MIRILIVLVFGACQAPLEARDDERLTIERITIIVD